MLTFQQSDKNVCRVAMYVEDDSVIHPIYINSELKENEIISERESLWDLVDLSIFPNKTQPRMVEVLEQCKDAINSGKIVTTRNSTKMFHDCFEKALANITEKVAYTFNKADNSVILPCPSLKENQRDFIVVSGESGVGKSTWTGSYCQTYHYTYPDRKIYLISAKDNDPSFDVLKFVERVPHDKLNDFIGKLANDKPEKEKEKEKEKELPKIKKTIIKRKEKPKRVEITIREEGEINKDDEVQKLKDEIKKKEEALEQFKLLFKQNPKIIPKNNEKKKDEKREFSNCLLIFDDIEHFQPISLRERIYAFKMEQTQIGRSKKVDIVLCNHMLRNYQKTREELLECTSLIFFPQASTFHINAYLKQYVGLDENTISKIVDPKNRWVMFNKQHPMSVVSQESIFLIKPKK